jgi:hypothetical protein
MKTLSFIFTLAMELDEELVKEIPLKVVAPADD